ncbi:hypothetical protein HDU87_000044 [Geranomyces variabilis]|uniref:Uncharacterized protein n=1 Tax=Geranomyces variabilis TaxID=109894 RepID=A0AAD5XR18_9FUNG|nr:hypothetical protein HDU87_000044 [Geranomyces variabilis]
MRNPLANLRARMALHSHPKHAPPIIIHLPAAAARPSLAATDDARRLRWCLSLKNVDWYEVVPPPGVLARLTGTSSIILPSLHASRDTPVLQMGRDFYYGVASATRGIERRCGHPTLYPARDGGGSDSIHASTAGLVAAPHGEADAAILRRWADTNLRPAASALALASAAGKAEEEAGAIDRVLAHLAHVESLLRASLPEGSSAKTAVSPPPDRRMAAAAAAAHAPSVTESTPSTIWHGLRGTSAPYPHAADIFIASTVLAIRDMRAPATNPSSPTTASNNAKLRSRLASACPLTLAWCARVDQYLAVKDADGEPLTISPEDCVSVLRNTYTVGELGSNNITSSSATGRPRRSRKVQMVTGEVFEGVVVVDGEQDVTLEYEMDAAEDGGAATPARCSITLPREEIVANSCPDKPSFQYVD